MADSRDASILVIGYGNTLRRDDGVGWRAAEAVERWGLPGVRVLCRTELTPDLAEDMAGADLVLLIDARLDVSTSEIGHESLELVQSGTSLTMAHSTSPQFLLGLCRALYERVPTAELISIPAPELGYGEGLSTVAERGLQLALELIERTVHEWEREPGG